MKRHVRMFCLAATVLFALSGVCRAEELKVGMFDFMKFVSKSTRAQELQKKLAALVDQKRQTLEAKKRELLSLKDQIEKQGPMLKEDTRTAKIKEFSMKETELKLFEQEAQSSVQNEQRETMAVVEKDVIRIITQIRHEKRLSFVLRADALLSADDSLDVTDEVVQMYDASTGGAAPKPAPKPAPKAPTSGAPKPK
jgi:Skp family chaperone for outer membrane proteins